MVLSNYASELLSKLMKLRKDRTLCDTVLTTCDGELWAHSIVLAAASEQMCSNFVSCCDVARSHFNVSLPNSNALSVEVVIRYLYTGNIILPVSYHGSSLFSDILLVCATLGMDVAKMNRVTVSFVKNSKDFEQ